jgi:hypothetical protein
MKSRIMSVVLACACASLARADFNPVELMPGSYTEDIVVESNTVPALPYCIDVTAGGGSGKGDYTYYEQGLYARPGQTGGNYGVPPHDSTFTNINDSSMTFLMPPDYSTNNTLMIDSEYTAGTLTFNVNMTATNLSILGTGGGGSVTVDYTVTHADASTESGSINYPDWFTGGSAVAWGANSRVNAGGGYQVPKASSVNDGAPYLYSHTITVSGDSPITSISFSYSSGAHANIFAVSGKAGGTASWTTIPVAGFNARGIVPAAFPLTATMDQGTNTANNGNLATWFEKGYVRDNSTNASYGLPPSGSIFDSITHPTHHFQMGDYSGNNAVLIDTNHLVANITPLEKTNVYTTFALLTAGGNIGGANVMTNFCILQHADGVNETNLFYAYDWYFTNSSVAFVANGRVNMYSRTINTLGQGNPKIFETFFPLTDTTSAVTNIMLQYVAAPGASATTYILAVSASTEGIPPVISSGPTPAVQGWYPTQTATFNVQATGTAPVTNTWMVQNNGEYVLLSDGVNANGSTIFGSGTSTLTISNLTSADATNYIFVAANAYGSITSSPAILEIKGIAGVNPMSGWNNIDNMNYPLGVTTNIYAGNGAATATLTLTDNGIKNGYTSGISGDGANYSLMHGYMDAGANSGQDGVVTIGGLTDSSYDVYIYCYGDISRPDSATAGLPNYSVNGTIYYAPTLGGSGASTYTATSSSVGGDGFNGFTPATTFTTNNFNKDLSVSSFGNYIKISGVVPSGGQITVQAEADTSSFRSPLNGIQLVGADNDGQVFSVNFLGSTTDVVSPEEPLKPVINSQSPDSQVDVLTNRSITTTFSVNVSPASAAPLFYQWCRDSAPIAGATKSSYDNVDTNNSTLYCVVSNFVGSVTSSPVSVVIFERPTPSAYQAAIFAYNPVAYWPLTETNGTIAYDYAGTNDGAYVGNVELGQPGLPATAGIGENTSVKFDGFSAYVDVPVNNLNITGPLTIIAWVKQTSDQSTNFGTILGHGDSGYRLSSSFGQARFADPGGDVSGPDINDGSWHQVAGVYDGTYQHLYLDGVEVGTPKTGTPNGNSGNVQIGSAPDYDLSRNINANIAQVAIIPSALSSNQVLAIYNSLDTPPSVAISPASPSIYSGTSLMLTASAGGTPPITYQWYYIDASSNSNLIEGATNATYDIDTVPSGYNGYKFGVIASNPYGTGNAEAALTVVDQAAYSPFGGGLYPAVAEAYVGAPVTYTADASGSQPIYYQWMLDGSLVEGATNASFTVPADCGIHSVMVSFTNEFSGGSPAISQSVSLQGDANPTNITFNTDGTGWVIQNNGNGSPSIVNNLMTLTDGTGSEGCAVWNYTAQYVGNFTASFTYQGVGDADGACFILQNDYRGLYAVGGAGGALGYGGVASSLALQFNLYNGNGETVGMALATNGNTGVYHSTGAVDIHSGHPIDVLVHGENGAISVSLKDTVTLATYSTNYNTGPITTILGGANVAYIGFSGGDGGATSVQTITNFVLHSVVSPVTLSASPMAGNTLILSWPAADPNYVLQSTSSLTNPSWGGSFNSVLVGNHYQVSVSATNGAQQFYRLVRVVNCP